jgi:hypothetical protein
MFAKMYELLEYISISAGVALTGSSYMVLGSVVDAQYCVKRVQKRRCSFAFYYVLAMLFALLEAVSVVTPVGSLAPGSILLIGTLAVLSMSAARVMERKAVSTRR